MNVRNVIVVCDYGYVEGGAARIACETALALSARGLKVTFFCAVGPVSEEFDGGCVLFRTERHIAGKKQI